MLQWIIKKEINSIKIGDNEIMLKARKGHAILDEYLVSEKVTPQELINTGFIPRAVRWEGGGGYSNTGESIIISGINGEALKPTFIKRRGHLACREHAMFLFYPGQPWVEIEASQWRGDFDIKMYQCILTNVGEIQRNLIWDIDNVDKENIIDEIPDKISKFKNAIVAAMDKAMCYHCRSPHYIKK